MRSLRVKVIIVKDAGESGAMPVFESEPIEIGSPAQALSQLAAELSGSLIGVGRACCAARVVELDADGREIRTMSEHWN